MTSAGMSRPILFGASTPSGTALRLQAQAVPADSTPLVAAGRRRPQQWPDTLPFVPCDLLAAPGDASTGLAQFGSQRWISFAPIWHLAPFLDQWLAFDPRHSHLLRGVVACSSSSVITKRFAANRFDRQLVQRLREAETLVQRRCADHGIPCTILAPTLIYGAAGPYGDRNLSQLLQLMRRLPVLPLPADTGLRQPVHCHQLAAVALHMSTRQAEGDRGLPAHLPLGGDDTMTYEQMLRRLQAATVQGDAARRCRLLPLPTRLFQLLASPLLLRSPKGFEAVLRISADLAGFSAAHGVLGEPARPFPVRPLAP
jgi:hypothetical protein